MSEPSTEQRFRIPEPSWAVLGLLLAWAGLVSQVRHHWGGESYYNFGWFVPAMSVWLLLRNLSRETVPAAPQGRLPGLHLAASIVVLAPVLIFHALSEVNPFWRVPLWAQSVSLSGFTLIVLHRFYGWNGIKAAAFPLFFLCTMIPWPFRMEQWIVHTLTQIVVTFAVGGLHFLSYPVEMAGNSLRLGEVNIGVNEACSGIRSLQALFMVTLFLGSLFGQTPARRFLAILILPVIVIIVNTIRATFLATQVIVNGQEAYDAWHDPAGYIAFGVSMVMIYAAIEVLNIGGSDTRQSQSLDLKAIAAGWAGSAATVRSLGYLLAPLLIYTAVEGWFRWHEMEAPASSGWELALPDPEDPDYRYGVIHDQVQSLLGYSYGYRFYHGLSNTAYVDVYYYGYEEDNKLSSVSSYGHAPTICMESSGARLVEEYEPAIIELDPLRIPVRHYLFELPQSQNKLHVFWTVWENRNMDIPPEDLQELNYRTQWIQLRKGRRDFSRQVFLASLAGIEEPSEARRVITGLLQDWITSPQD